MFFPHACILEIKKLNLDRVSRFFTFILESAQLHQLLCYFMGCVAKTGAADGRVTDVSAQPHLHAQIQPVQVASLPSFHHLIMCALVSELPTVLPTSSRDGE